MAVRNRGSSKPWRGTALFVVRFAKKPNRGVAGRFAVCGTVVNTSPEDEPPKGSQAGKENEKEVKKSKKGSKDGSKKKSKKGSADGTDPSSSSSSSSSSDSSSSGDESVPEKKENKKKRELSDSDGEWFSLGDLRIKRRRQDADLSADTPKRPQFANLPGSTVPKTASLPTGSGP